MSIYKRLVDFPVCRCVSPNKLAFVCLFCLGSPATTQKLLNHAVVELLILGSDYKHIENVRVRNLPLALSGKFHYRPALLSICNRDITRK